MGKKKKKSTRSSKDRKMSKLLDEKFLEELGETERFGNEKITKVNVAQADMDYTRLFGANKNLYRSTPNMICGLKPGAMRLIYTWWETCGSPQNTKKETLNKLKYYKVNKLASDSVKYHPHGTVSQEGLLGTMGQYWSNNVMLLVPQGSYGNLRGDQVASGRYIMAKMSEFCIDCFFTDFDKYGVPMREAYTGEDEEPDFLPARYPYILFNPQFSGIGLVA